jgi:hypothetical protein
MFWWEGSYLSATVKAMYVPQTKIVSPDIPIGAVEKGTEVKLLQKLKVQIYIIHWTTVTRTPRRQRFIIHLQLKLKKYCTIKAYAKKAGMEDSYMLSYRYVVNYPVRDFLGVCNDVVPGIEGVGWSRFDVEWGSVEPQEGLWRQNVLESYAREFCLTVKRAMNRLWFYVL